MNKGENIRVITENALCSACGSCSGICPVDAIQMETNPAGFLNAVVDETTCIHCGKCMRVCPSNGERTDPDLVGPTISGYIGYAVDPVLRLESQSGGVVTALMRYMLAKKLVDGVVVSRFNCETRRAEGFLASKVEQLDSSRGSHYTQTSPVDLILRNQDKRLAAVLLGCQTAALQQIATHDPRIKLPVFTIGLICGGNLSGYVVDDILTQGGVKLDHQLHSFRFRDKQYGGWPGNITARTDRLVEIPKETRMELKPYYQNFRCILCADKMNQCCDLVAGDPWGVSIEDESAGYTAVITRNQKAETLLKNAVSTGCLVMKANEIEEIVEGQKITSDLAVRHRRTQNICLAKQWRYPYQLQMENKTEITAQEEALLKKLSYLRELYLSTTTEKAKRLIRARKKEDYHPIREILYQLKKRMLG